MGYKKTSPNFVEFCLKIKVIRHFILFLVGHLQRNLLPFVMYINQYYIRISSSDIFLQSNSSPEICELKPLVLTTINVQLLLYHFIHFFLHRDIFQRDLA